MDLRAGSERVDQTATRVCWGQLSASCHSLWRAGEPAKCGPLEAFLAFERHHLVLVARARDWDWRRSQGQLRQFQAWAPFGPLLPPNKLSICPLLARLSPGRLAPLASLRAARACQFAAATCRPVVAPLVVLDQRLHLRHLQTDRQTDSRGAESVWRWNRVQT